MEMKKYYEYGFAPSGETDKAYCFDFSLNGINTVTHEWFPKSQCILGEQNEVGNRIIWIPAWLISQKNINPQRCVMNFWGLVEK